MELKNSFEVARPIDEAWAVLTDLERIAPCLPGAQLTEVEGDDYRGSVKVKVGPITAQFKGAANFVERNDQDHTAVLSGKGRDTRGAGNASALITARLEAVSDSTTSVDVDTDLRITGKFAQFGRGVMADVSATLMDQFAQNLAEMLAEDGAGQGGAATAEATAVDVSDAGGGGADVDVSDAGGGGADVDVSDDGGGADVDASDDGDGADVDVSDDGGGADVDADAGGGGADVDMDTAGVGGVRRIDMPEPAAIDLIDAAGAPVAKRVAALAAVVVALVLLRRLLRRSR
ncbi:MAG: SRPBCC family protein [Acidimicrobiaceae bacterium]|nr:SRPBCC family protein [Acidimicrobiaceae bacterium]